MSLHPETGLDLVNLIKNHPLAFVKWGAEWCKPCQRIQPHFDALAEAHSTQAVFISVGADQEGLQELALAYQINSLPTFQVFVDHKLVDTLIGANPASLTQLVSKYVSSQ